MQIPHTHQIFLQKKVLVVRHELPHDFWAANGVIHEMQLPFQNQELIKLRAVVDKPVFFPLNYNRLIIVPVQLKSSIFRHLMQAPIFLLNNLMWQIPPLLHAQGLAVPIPHVRTQCVIFEEEKFLA